MTTPGRTSPGSRTITKGEAMNEIHRRGAYFVTSEEPGIYRVWRDGFPVAFVDLFMGRNAATRAREKCADCADAEDRKASR